MTDHLDPRLGGEYQNELIVAGLEAYDAHKTLLLKNITQSGYTMGNMPVAAAPPAPDREFQLQVQAQDREQPMQARVAALREILSNRRLQNGA